MCSALDAATGKVIEERLEAHGYARLLSSSRCRLSSRRSPVNRIANCFGNLLASGDDDGLIKVRIIACSTESRADILLAMGPQTERRGPRVRPPLGIYLGFRVSG